MQSKQAIRKTMLAKRLAMSSEAKHARESSIINHIASLPLFQKAEVITLYMPIQGEADLLPLWRTCNKVVLFPKVCSDMLAFCPAQCMEDFEQGCYGILEPLNAEAFAMHKIDLIIVPGLVFDRDGHRLGYGKGYYDRLINTNPGVTTLGVCFDEFFIERLPVDPWDAKVNLVVTQTGIFRSEGEV
jgi:5-formyltetrahydrofolate cyclo-ligase